MSDQRTKSLLLHILEDLRNCTAHGYHALDDEIVWNIAKNEISNLVVTVKSELMLLNNPELN